jgi:hypothetical protein
MEGASLPTHGGVGKAKVDVALDAQLERLTDLSLMEWE